MPRATSVKTVVNMPCKALRCDHVVMIVFDYPTKRSLIASVGSKLKVRGNPYVPMTGDIAGCNRPWLTGFNREFYAVVSIRNGLIVKVK